MKTLDEHTISSAVREVMPRYDITEAYLFDSYARNEADEESDVDIAATPSRSSPWEDPALLWRLPSVAPWMSCAAAIPSTRALNSATLKTEIFFMRNPKLA